MYVELSLFWSSIYEGLISCRTVMKSIFDASIEENRILIPCTLERSQILISQSGNT